MAAVDAAGRPATRRDRRWRAVLSPGWILLFGGVWWLLAGGRGWALGVVAIAAALIVRAGLGAPPARTWSPRGLIRFLPFFLLESVRGGVDVALRALAPRMPIAPGLRRYALTLPDGPARLLFVNAVSLLPGTFAAELERDALVLHVLTGGEEYEARLRALERRTADLFGEPWPDRREPPA